MIAAGLVLFEFVRKDAHEIGVHINMLDVLFYFLHVGEVVISQVPVPGCGEIFLISCKWAEHILLFDLLTAAGGVVGLFQLDQNVHFIELFSGIEPIFFVCLVFARGFGLLWILLHFVFDFCLGEEEVFLLVFSQNRLRWIALQVRSCVFVRVGAEI